MIISVWFLIIVVGGKAITSVPQESREKCISVATVLNEKVFTKAYCVPGVLGVEK